MAYLVNTINNINIKSITTTINVKNTNINCISTRNYIINISGIIANKKELYLNKNSSNGELLIVTIVGIGLFLIFFCCDKNGECIHLK